MLPLENVRAKTLPEPPPCSHHNLISSSAALSRKRSKVANSDEVANTIDKGILKRKTNCLLIETSVDFNSAQSEPSGSQSVSIRRSQSLGELNPF